MATFTALAKTYSTNVSAIQFKVRSWAWQIFVQQKFPQATCIRYNNYSSLRRKRGYSLINYIKLAINYYIALTLQTRSRPFSNFVLT
jgi:pyoverdine/dityrosine biosynthesis protein Dit1